MLSLSHDLPASGMSLHCHPKNLSLGLVGYLDGSRRSSMDFLPIFFIYFFMCCHCKFRRTSFVTYCFWL